MKNEGGGVTGAKPSAVEGFVEGIRKSSGNIQREQGKEMSKPETALFSHAGITTHASELHGIQDIREPEREQKQYVTAVLSHAGIKTLASPHGNKDTREPEGVPNQYKTHTKSSSLINFQMDNQYDGKMEDKKQNKGSSTFTMINKEENQFLVEDRNPVSKQTFHFKRNPY